MGVFWTEFSMQLIHLFVKEDSSKLVDIQFRVLPVEWFWFEALKLHLWAVVDDQTLHFIFFIHTHKKNLPFDLAEFFFELSVLQLFVHVATFLPKRFSFAELQKESSGRHRQARDVLVKS